MNKKNNFIIKGLKKSLIASCQPIPKGPLDSSPFILASEVAFVHASGNPEWDGQN